MNHLKRPLQYFLCIIVIVAVLISPIGSLEDQQSSNVYKVNQETEGDIIVIFHKELSAQELSGFIKSQDSSVQLKRHIGDYALLYIEDRSSYDMALSQLQKDPRVKTAQANQKITILNNSDDPLSDSQWAIKNPGNYTLRNDEGEKKIDSTKGVDMDVVQAWEYDKLNITDKNEVVIAILDTGVDYNHPDLEDRMWINKKEIPRDNIDNDNNGYVDDIYGWDFYNQDATVCHYKYNKNLKLNLSSPEDNDDHGTHVAGIIAAKGNNKIGIAGVASNVEVKIMALKINGGPKGAGDTASAIEAVKYATKMGADICNLSWGTEKYNEALEIVMKESDMLFVAAAGNTGEDNDKTPVYPASFNLPNVISVTFINPDGKLTAYSNYGTSSVDIAAPGVDIVSTIVGHYGTMSGSSMATPHVTAVASMLYSLNPKVYPSNIKNIILDHKKPLKSLNGYISNPGIPNAFQALENKKSIIIDKKAPTMILHTMHDLGKIVVPIYADDNGGADIRVMRWLIGKRSIGDFQRGTVGTRIVDSQVSFHKAGTYTFYVSDYAGNETIQSYKVEDDKTPPIISTDYVLSKDNKTATLTVRVSDPFSGIKRVKYADGKVSASDMLAATKGKEITLINGKVSLKVKAQTVYTIYAIDYRGNHIVSHVDVKVIKAEQIKFLRSSRELKVGDQLTMPAFLKPANTTDIVSYSSSNPAIVSVSGNGKIKALKPGKVTINAKTNGGVRTACTIVVR